MKTIQTSPNSYGKLSYTPVLVGLPGFPVRSGAGMPSLVSQEAQGHTTSQAELTLES